MMTNTPNLEIIERAEEITMEQIIKNMFDEALGYICKAELE